MRKYYEPSGTVEEKGGPSVRYHESSFDGTLQPYAIYVPEDYSPERKWPLVISLHGFSSDHVLNLRRVFGLGNKSGQTDVECKQVFPVFPDVKFIVASPYAFGSVGYGAQGEIDALDVLQDVKSHYSIDDDRVYLTGLSMGGEGTWHIAIRYPHLWAAIAPVCAPVAMFTGPEDVRCFADNLTNLNVHISHGSADCVVPVEWSRDMYRILKESGVPCVYEEYSGVDHNAWDYTYADARIFEWFSQFERVRKPSRVVYSTDRLRYNSAYWVEITRISSWTKIARIEAQVHDGNLIHVTTDNIDAFKLDLCNAPLDVEMPVTIICNGEEILSELVSTCSVEIELAEPVQGELLKRKGMEGPVYDALRSRFIVVYGTQTDDSDLKESLRCAAECAAHWSEWADIDIPVLPDTDITDEDIANNNLILAGDDKTNKLIGLINNRLPVRFTDKGVSVGDTEFEGDLGIIKVYPNPLNQEKYAVIIGGRSSDILEKVSVSYRDMPDYGVLSMQTKFPEPDTFTAYGYFDGKWQLE